MGESGCRFVLQLPSHTAKERVRVRRFGGLRSRAKPWCSRAVVVTRCQADRSSTVEEVRQGRDCRLSVWQLARLLQAGSSPVDGPWQLPRFELHNPRLSGPRKPPAQVFAELAGPVFHLRWIGHRRLRPTGSVPLAHTCLSCPEAPRPAPGPASPGLTLLYPSPRPPHGHSRALIRLPPRLAVA